MQQLIHAFQQLESLPDITAETVEEAIGVARNLMTSVCGKQIGEYEDLNELRTNPYVATKDLRILPTTENAFAHHLKWAILQTCIWVWAD